MHHHPHISSAGYSRFGLAARLLAAALGLSLLAVSSAQTATDPDLQAADPVRQLTGLGEPLEQADPSHLPALPAWVIVPDDAAALRGVLHPASLSEPGHGRVEFDSLASVEQLISFYTAHFRRAGFDIRVARDILDTSTAERTGIRAGLAIDHRASGRTLDVIIHERTDQRLVRLRYRGG